MTSSCADLPPELYRAAYDNTQMFFSNGNPIKLDQEYVKTNKYSSIKVRLGKSQAAIMILVRQQDGIKEWISADRVKIYTYNGKIIKTVGLSNDYEALDPEDSFGLNKSHEESGSYLVNFYGPELFNIDTQYQVTYKNKKLLKNVIENKGPIKADVYIETLQNRSIGWKVQNKYFYLDGIPLRTEQYTNPFLKKISIDFIDAY